MLENIYIHFHAPRTGGTAFQNYIGSAYSRDNDTCWFHYHWTDNFSQAQYIHNNIPLLRFRNKDQQKKLKFITGHSTFSNSHEWLKINKTPRYITFVRDPVERILSSFNYRYSRKTLLQDESFFSANPLMNFNAVDNKKNEKDYDTLYEFYKDAYIENNLQSKWIIKSFLRLNDDGLWSYHPTYDGTNNFTIDPRLMVPVTMPQWMWSNHYFDYWNLVEPLLGKFWWISTLDNFKQNIKDLCNSTGVMFNDNVDENKSDKIVNPFWTIDDVKKQPDYHRIVEDEEFDYKLYNYVKNNSLNPFK
jgi:hypothetical protein